MGMNETVSAERIHIGFFGVRNAGKSSVVNAVTGQEMALVSEIKGTTTDPVKKTMELLPLGPVVIIDTPGIDDEGTLGELRVKKTRQVLNYTDVAVLVVDGSRGMCAADHELIQLFQEKQLPYVIAYNKADLMQKEQAEDDSDESKKIDAKESVVNPHGTAIPKQECALRISARTGQNIYELKEKIGHLMKQQEQNKHLVADLLEMQDLVVLVVPIDSAAPKGRLILPQQQVIRDALEVGAVVTVVRESELAYALETSPKKPKMVITDSQVFGAVSKIVPEDVLLTSFSILMARYKGELETVIRGAAYLDQLQDGDTVLISEGCTHHRQCDDIGTVKLPAWVKNYTKKDLKFEFTSGMGFPELSAPDGNGVSDGQETGKGENCSRYAMIIHCGACMLTEREMHSRLRQAAEANVPITNYGIAIAKMHGILKRSLGPFPKLQQLID
jgi:[FeFe] hydrogenase H-cluster maturation GTPase HydF